uniref:60S ribosomal protein L34 n=1 Tax=Steinernema glaseri TaxID=37863 RepID=A0A1I7Y1B7_9BILA
MQISESPDTLTHCCLPRAFQLHQRSAGPHEHALLSMYLGTDRHPPSRLPTSTTLKYLPRLLHFERLLLLSHARTHSYVMVRSCGRRSSGQVLQPIEKKKYMRRADVTKLVICAGCTRAIHVAYIRQEKRLSVKPPKNTPDGKAKKSTDTEDRLK